MIKTIAIIVRIGANEESDPKPKWFPFKWDTEELIGYGAATFRAEELLHQEFGDCVHLSYSDDLHWVEKQNYTKI